MTARQRVLLHLADLADDDVDALLPIVEHLRAKRIGPVFTELSGKQEQAGAQLERRHPKRFGPLAGTVKMAGDTESPVESADAWTHDEENLKS